MLPWLAGTGLWGSVVFPGSVGVCQIPEITQPYAAIFSLKNNHDKKSGNLPESALTCVAIV